MHHFMVKRGLNRKVIAILSAPLKLVWLLIMWCKLKVVFGMAAMSFLCRGVWFLPKLSYHRNVSCLAMVAWRLSSGLMTELSLSQWINPRLGRAWLYDTNGPAMLCTSWMCDICQFSIFLFVKKQKHLRSFLKKPNIRGGK